MAVAFDAVGPAGGAGTQSSTSPLTWTHINNGNGILVGVTAFSGSTNNVTGVTYGGTSLTFLGYANSGNGGAAGGGISLYGLTGGTVPTGSNTVSVSFSAANNHIGGSISVSGAGSLGTPVTAAPAGSGTGAITVNGTTTGGLIVSVCCQGSNGAFSATSPNVLRYTKLNSAGSGSDNTAGGTDPSTGGGANQTVTWTNATSDDWGIVAVEVLPAAGAAGSLPGSAAPGKTWLRRFHHRQFPQQAPAVIAAPVSGPPVYPLQHPVMAVRPSQLRGGVTASRDGVYAQLGPPVTPLRGPVASRGRGLPPKGRPAGNDGTFNQAGPRVYPLRGPVASRGRGLPSRGRTSSNDGIYAQLGPAVYPLRGPVRTRPQPPPRGRCAANRGTYAQLGPPVTPLRGPVAARQPLPRRGRCAGSQGAPVAAPPPQGAAAPPLHSPVRTRPQPPPRGRTAGNPGTRQQTGPPVTPLRGPVQARRPLPSRGRCAGNAGTSTVVVITSGSPVYPLHGPVRTRPQPPPRGRCAGSRGVRHQAGPAVRPLDGPVAPFRPGPYRSGRCASSDGTYAQLGPRVYPLQRPVRARIPQRPRGGRTAANAGAPVFVPPFTIGALTAADTARYALTAAGASSALTASTAASGALTANDQRTGGPS